MAGDGVAVAAGTGMWAFNNIELRPVVLEKIEVGGGEIRERIAKVADHRHGFQEDFREHDSRAYVQIDASVVDVLDERAEQAKIMMRGAAQGFAVGGGM